MLSNRCKIAVKEILKEQGLHFIFVDLGEIDVMENLDAAELMVLQNALKERGFELIDDKKSILIEKIKGVVVDMVHYSDEVPKVTFSIYLEEKLHYDYTYMANLFSEVQGMTIEHFIIFNKIERIKELIIYGELNITEIAWKMNYSSVAHLSNQFKKVTGLSPSSFKLLKAKNRIPIDELTI